MKYLLLIKFIFFSFIFYSQCGSGSTSIPTAGVSIYDPLTSCAPACQQVDDPISPSVSPNTVLTFTTDYFTEGPCYYLGSVYALYSDGTTELMVSYTEITPTPTTTFSFTTTKTLVAIRVISSTTCPEPNDGEEQSEFSIGIGNICATPVCTPGSNTTSTASICENQTKALTASAGGGTWSIVSGGGSVSGNTYTPSNVSSNTNVTVRYTDECGTTSDRTFTVNARNVASNTTSTAAICENSTKALVGSPAGGSWSVVSGGGSISGNTYTPSNVSSNTNITVRYTIATNGSCPATTSDRTFTVNSNPGTASNSTTGTAICENGTKALVGSPAGGIWNVVSGGGTISGTTYTPANVTSNTNVTVRYRIPANGACPQTTSNRTFTVNPSPGTASNTTSTAAICEGTAKSLIGTPAGGTWSILSGAGSISGSTYNSGNITSNSTVTVRYTIAANGNCSGSTSDRTFTVNSNPGTASNSTTGTAICENGTKALVGSPAGGIWNVVSGGGTISGTTYTPANVTSNTNVTVRYRIPANGACPQTTSNRTFTVNARNVASNTTSNAAICESSTKALLGSPAGGTWSVVSGGGTISGTTYTPANVTSNTPVTVRYTIPSNGACPATTSNRTFTVEVNSSSANNTTTTAAICENGTKVLTGTPTGGNWSVVSGGGTISGSTYTPSNVTANTPVTVRYTIPANGSCPATTSNRTFTVNVRNVASNTTTGAAICENDTKALIGSPTGGIWNVVSGGGTISGSTYTPANVTSNTSVTVRYRIPANGACPQTTSNRTFTVNVRNVASNTTTTASVCENGTKTLVGSPAGGSWSVVSGGGTISGSTYTPANVTSNTNVTVRYTLPANGACPQTTSNRTFTVTPESVAPTGISGTTTICEGGSTTLTLVGGFSGTGGSAEWFSGSCGGTSAGTGNSITISPLSTTTYFVRYTGTCNTTACVSQVVTVNPLDEASFSYSGGTFCLTGSNPSPSITGLTGGTFSINNGGVINPSTGVINLSSSGIGSYVVTYLTNGPCPSSETANVSITSAPTAAFSYTGSPYCSNGSNPEVTFSSGASGGVFSDQGATGNLMINSNTGEIDLSNSDAGTYTIGNNIAAAGGCAAANATTSITIIQSDESAFTLSSGSACQNGSDITANITGTTGGNFTSVPSGLSINGSTGAIDVSASTGNTYMVTYTTTGTCPDFSSQSVTITTADDATFTLSSSSACQNGSDITATITGTSGGTFTSSPSTGLSFNSSTGAIDVSESDAGTYDLTYTTTGTCPEMSTLSVTITLDDDATFSYSGSTFCLTGSDPNPTVTGTTGGSFTSAPAGLSINGNTGEIDLSASSVNTYDITYTTSGICSESLTIQLTVTSAPTADFSYTGSPYCSNGSNPEVTFSSGASGGVFSDQGATGNLTINSSTGEIDLSNSDAGTYTIENNIVAAGGCAAANATTSITITLADEAGYNYGSSTYCLTGSDPTPMITGTTGGTFTSTPTGLVINGSTGEITLSTSLVNTYDITYTTPNICFKDSIVQIIITGSPTADFSYPNALYCEDNGGTSVAPIALNPGSSGGVFSDQGATGNLTINSSTGEIDLSSSDAGTYTIENNIIAANGCAAANATAIITITEQDDPGFSYSSTSFCEGDANAVSTISGTSGGTFASSPSGLSINSSTGEVDLSSSTNDITYTITYTTSGTCPDSENQQLIINSAPVSPTISTSQTNNTICLGDSIEVIATGSGTNISYSVYNAISGGSLLGTTDLTVTPNTTTDYFIEAQNSAGCTPINGRESVTVTVNPLPIIEAGTDEEICPDETITLTATGTGVYSWSTLESSQSIDVSPSITTKYYVTLTDLNQCENIDSVIVEVRTLNGSIVAVDDLFTSSQGEETLLDVLFNDTYIGNTPNIIIDVLNGVTSVGVDGVITYKSSDDFEGNDNLTYTICSSVCSNLCDTGQVDIEVLSSSEVLVSGGVSPNGDNVNDLLFIQGIEKYPNNILSIFNRWGGLVYQSAPYNNDWDGSTNSIGIVIGDKVTTGTYFYILDLGDETEILRGSIEVKR